MFTEIRGALRPAVILLATLALLTGLVFPAVVTGIAQVTMPGAANGSLIREGDRIIGSELIAQGFAGPAYFHSRPSAAGQGYDASASAGTNLAPGSQALRDAIAARVTEARAQGLTGDLVPPDLVTTSASGLDPDLSPEAALSQIKRVAAARAIDEGRLRSLVAEQVERPLLGIIGEPRVNVLLLNRQLDRIAPIKR
ncbi:potassium-transporting ATPase subunit KdpC [Rhizorhabdus sp. FW153]|uniref:potassium-transporting ATPase subunit KdpC n=1 Tax=Rhizorhabdus sp. FW153 TaxID=3400216 RepID=UPI003CF676E4